jgi:signal transduction histidine kinase
VEKIDALLGTEVGVKQAWQRCVQSRVKEQIETASYNNRFVRVLITPITMDETNTEVIGTVILLEDVTEARQLQKTRDEFFAVASHELRTPLTAIRGNMALIRDYYPKLLEDPEVKQMIDDTHTASLRLISIVNDFLDASRLELKKLQFNLEKFEIVPLVKEGIKGLESPLKEKNLTWRLDTQLETGLLVEADKSRVLQVVVNLLGNAIKYTQKGEIKVWVEGDNQMVKVKVTDTGNGMDPEQQQFLFQKFKQVGAVGYTRDAAQSTGMGLYIAKLLVEAMGGKVYLEWSEKGKGSTFTVELKRAEAT